MSWFRDAVSKAVEGNKTGLSRIRTYADSVGQVVVGSAKLLQDRIGNRSVQSFRESIKTLEEQSVSCKGDDRVFLLRRWLNSLTEAERIGRGLVEEMDYMYYESTTPTELYVDLDQGGEPLTFRDVFLQSEAIEGMVLSMILDAPNDEEIALLMEIFGLCLMGGTDVHTAVVSSIEDLAKVFSSYHDEVLMKRDELLKFAQSAISGLKFSAELERIDVEVRSLKERLRTEEMKISIRDKLNKSSEEPALATKEAKEALAQVRLYSKLKALLLEKKCVYNGDSPEDHSNKVDKLKILLESLRNSTATAEQQIEDHRSHKEETLSFRQAKTNEVSQVEKDLEAEIGSLKKQKEELEALLQKVTAKLDSVNMRLHNAREERRQLDEASSDILQQLQTKEEELKKSVACCKTEKHVAAAWISFVESTWRLQSKFSQQKEEAVNAELRRHAEHFLNLATQILLGYKNELEISLDNFRELVTQLKSNDWSDSQSDSPGCGSPTSVQNGKRAEEYLDLEAKLNKTFSIVESIKHLYAQSQDFCGNNDHSIEELLEELEKWRHDFDSIERPDLTVDVGTPSEASWMIETPTMMSWRLISRKLAFGETPTKFEPIPEKECADSPGMMINGQKFLDSDEELDTLESEYAHIIKHHSGGAELDDWVV